MNRQPKRPVPHDGKGFSVPQPGVGFLLADSSLQPLYANPQAVQILAYPGKVEKISSQESFLSAKMRSIIPDGGLTKDAVLTREVVSGKRRYMCRVFSVSTFAHNSSQPSVAVLFERPSLSLVHISRITAQCHLTPRELQTVELLVQGLSDQEIADRMRISPNTVKAFLRLVMNRMGVSTRSGIVGKIVFSKD